MKLEHFHKIITALETLLTNYQNNLDAMTGDTPCPLCETMKTIAAETGDTLCKRCPWVVLTGKTCYGNFKLFVGPHYDRCDRYWINMRLEQLPYWIYGYRSNYALPLSSAVITS